MWSHTRRHANQHQESLQLDSHDGTSTVSFLSSSGHLQTFLDEKLFSCSTLQVKSFRVTQGSLTVMQFVLLITYCLIEGGIGISVVSIKQPAMRLCIYPDRLTRQNYQQRKAEGLWGFQVHMPPAFIHLPPWLCYYFSAISSPRSPCICLLLHNT